MPSDAGDLQRQLRDTLAANAELTMGSLDTVLPDLEQAATAITQCFLADGKLLTCGTGTSAAISEYCAAVFANRLERERPGLPAMSLSASNVLDQAIAHSVSQHEVQSRQVRSLGMSHDCLLIFGPGSDSTASVQAVSAAHDRSLQIVAVTGSGDTDLSSLLSPEDIEIHVPTHSAARLAEAALFLTHCLCESVEFLLFGLERQ